LNEGKKGARQTYYYSRNRFGDGRDKVERDLSGGPKKGLAGGQRRKISKWLSRKSPRRWRGGEGGQGGVV